MTAKKTWSDEPVKRKMTVAEAMRMSEAEAAMLWLEETRDLAYRNAVLAELFEQNPTLFASANELPC